MTRLVVEDVTFGWSRQQPLLSGLSLQAGAGDGVVLAGGNGTGKSTLMQLVAGYRAPWSGHIRIDGRPATSAAARRARWYMESAPALYRLLTVREQLIFYARACGGQPTACLELFERLCGTAAVDALCAELSSGQAQKAWFAASMTAHRAQLLLLDEPFSATDAASVPFLVDLITEFRRRGGTVVLVTHAHAQLLATGWRTVSLRAATPPDVMAPAIQRTGALLTNPLA